LEGAENAGGIAGRGEANEPHGALLEVRADSRLAASAEETDSRGGEAERDQRELKDGFVATAADQIPAVEGGPNKGATETRRAYHKRADEGKGD